MKNPNESIKEAEPVQHDTYDDPDFDDYTSPTIVPNLTFVGKTSQPLGARGLYIHRENDDVHENV